MNYLKIIRDALLAAQALPVYAMAAPQGTTANHIVIQTLYNQDEETVILAADFTFTIKTT
jgi:hypothetical protein